MANTLCRSCKAPITWVKTNLGRWIPLNADAVDGGNIELRDGVAHVVTAEPGVERFVAHFASCGQAKEWRKR